MPEETKADNTI